MNDPARQSTVFGGIALAIAVEDDRWHGLEDVEAIVRSCAIAAARRVRLASDVETELGLTLTDDATVRQLNAKWRGKDKPTDVLSFPMQNLAPGEAPGAMLGDLVFAFETLARESEAEGKSLADHFRHLVVHGILHCLGYDHVEPNGADAMEALEIAVLKDLGVADPYRETESDKEPLRA